MTPTALRRRSLVLLDAGRMGAAAKKFFCFEHRSFHRVAFDVVIVVVVVIV